MGFVPRVTAPRGRDTVAATRTCPQARAALRSHARRCCRTQPTMSAQPRTNPRVVQRTFAPQPSDLTNPADPATPEWIAAYTEQLTARTAHHMTVICDPDTSPTAPAENSPTVTSATQTGPTQRPGHLHLPRTPRLQTAQVIAHEIGHHCWPADQNRQRFFPKIQLHLFDRQRLRATKSEAQLPTA
jgi:hypothetical protein